MNDQHKINWEHLFKSLKNYKHTKEIHYRNLILEHIWDYIKKQCSAKCSRQAYYIDPRDTYSNVTIEVIKAIERFDPDGEESHPAQFASCIYKTIHFQVSKAIAECRGVKRHDLHCYAMLSKVAHMLNIELNDQIPHETIEKALNLKKGAGKAILDGYKRIVFKTNSQDIQNYSHIIPCRQKSAYVKEVWEIIRNHYSEEEIDILERAYIDEQSVSEMLSEVKMSRSQINYLKKRVRSTLRCFFNTI